MLPSFRCSQSIFSLSRASGALFVSLASILTAFSSGAHAEPADLPGAKILPEAVRGLPRGERRGRAGQIRRAAAREPLGGIAGQAHRPHDAGRQRGRLRGRGCQAGSQYIYEAFYSPAAQAQDSPAGVRSRAADHRAIPHVGGGCGGSISHRRSIQALGKERGLKAHYSGLLIEKPPEPDESTEPAARRRSRQAAAKARGKEEGSSAGELRPQRRAGLLFLRRRQPRAGKEWSPGILRPLGRLGDRRGDGHVRVHHQDRERRAALGE